MSLLLLFALIIFEFSHSTVNFNFNILNWTFNPAVFSQNSSHNKSHSPSAKIQIHWGIFTKALSLSLFPARNKRARARLRRRRAWKKKNKKKKPTRQWRWRRRQRKLLMMTFKCSSARSAPLPLRARARRLPLLMLACYIKRVQRSVRYYICIHIHIYAACIYIYIYTGRDKGAFTPRIEIDALFSLCQNA